jgi:hypothetical protein
VFCAGVDPSSISMIFKGRRLENSKSLVESGVAGSSPVLVMVKKEDSTTAEAAKRLRLAQLKKVVEGLASGRPQDDQYELQLENQAGRLLCFSPEDQKALVMGLSLHQRGKRSMAAVSVCPSPPSTEQQQQQQPRPALFSCATASLPLLSAPLLPPGEIQGGPGGAAAIRGGVWSGRPGPAEWDRQLRHALFGCGLVRKSGVVEASQGMRERTGGEGHWCYGESRGSRRLSLRGWG